MDKLKIKTYKFNTIDVLIQKQVNAIFKERFKKKPSKDFQYIVSLSGKHCQKINLTIVNGNLKFTETIFPQKSASPYGIESLDEIMERLFNRTM